MPDFTFHTSPDLNNVWLAEPVSRWLASSTSSDYFDLSRELWLLTRFPKGLSHHQGARYCQDSSTSSKQG